MERLNIESKTQNQGATSSGKLSALEFNNLVNKVNELVDANNKTICLSQDEYDALLAAGRVVEDVEYNVYEE